MSSEWRAWVKDVGFPIVVALLLLALVTRDIPATAARVDALGRALDQHNTESFGRGTDTLRLLRAICRHAAKNDFQLQECSE